MRKKITVLTLLLLAIANIFPATAYASDYETWGEVANDMETILNESYEIFVSGDTDGGKSKVDEAYFG
ncbi:MAG: iron permease, partial [Clostridiales Family XIII bacterium]|nr:iron permease [Clostridiales Family XIII bacterium]